MKNSLLVTKLVDNLQAHRYVEEARFGQVEGAAFAVLSTWRFMLRRHFLVMVELASDDGRGGGADLVNQMKAIRARARELTGGVTRFRPQAWQWLVISQPSAFRGVEFAEPVMAFDPASSEAEVISGGGAHESFVLKLLSNH